MRSDRRQRRLEKPVVYKGRRQLQGVGAGALNRQIAMARKHAISDICLERAKEELGVSTIRPANGGRTNEICYSLTPDPTVWQPASPG